MKAQQSKHAANTPTVRASSRSIYDPANGHFRSLTVYAESPDCAKAARDMVSSYLQTWGLPHAVDAAQLVVSELVGNVVHHAVPDNRLSQPGAGRRIDVTLMTWPEVLVLGVTDEDSTPPDLPPGDFVSPELAGDFVEAMLPDRGRGLFIAQRLAESVWWSPGIRGGKTVWCRFDLDQLRADYLA
ncbi:ATP-binding protein [Streptomyces sp. NPDC051963]|uniref:ATP-binding protein n=1 Tax=Streptomyces sp. NPDC051963 TaxID=3365678 RepID=UPI0037CE7FC5